MSFDGLVILLDVIAGIIFVWSAALFIAVNRNCRPYVAHWPDGSRSIPLVDFGPLVFSGTILWVTFVLSAIYAGLTIN